jgi:Icc protein
MTTSPDVLRIGLIADLHNGPNPVITRGVQAIALLENALKRIHRARVDMVVDLGDRINSGDRHSEQERLGQAADLLREIPEQRVHLLGNHDIDHLSPGDNERALQTECVSRVVRVGEWELLFWYANVNPGPHGYTLNTGDLEWLDHASAQLSRPTLLFSHIPIGGAPITGNRYFEKLPAGAACYSNAERAREIVRRQEAIVACIAGHTHWNTIHLADGVPHITVQSVTQSFTVPDKPTACHGILTLRQDRFRLEVVGNDPFIVERPIPSGDSRQLPSAEWSG